MTDLIEGGAERIYLEPSPGVDCTHPRMVALARELTSGAGSPTEGAVRLFAFVRDGVRYIPYAPFQTLSDYEGAAVLERGFGFCTQKSALLISLARAAGIPARFRYADLLNHNMPGRLESVLQSNRMIFHTYVELRPGRRWLKATPSFEAALCEKMGWRLVDFDGSADAVLHAQDLSGRPHIEYVKDRGHSAGVPLNQMLEAWREGYGEEALERWQAARSKGFNGDGPPPSGTGGGTRR